MSSLMVVGSVAFDSIETPFGQGVDILGGAASYFSVGAALFTRVRMVGVIGEDFPEAHIDMFKERNIDTSGLQRIPGGKTFRWKGRYKGRMDIAQTIDTQLNVLGDCRPVIPSTFSDSHFVLLANDNPENQLHVAKQMKDARFVMMDTMNLWIDKFRDGVHRVLKEVDGIVLNDEEARALGEDSNLIVAMKNIRSLGPDTVLVKKGEHGSIIHHGEHFFALPAYPLEVVRDPTGAGDTFAAGFMGYLSRTNQISFGAFKTAMLYGTVLASYNVEAMGLDRIKTLKWADVESRFAEFVRFLDHES